MTSVRAIGSDFHGTIGRTLADSTPSFATPPHPGEDAPNVVMVVIDDAGYAQFGCYGSTIDTPNIDALAAGGLRYSNFHVTPLCSPTRAALLTGRNHHTVGMRSISNYNTGFPHMRGHITNHATTMAEVLRDQGYATFAIGKWHLCQMADASAAGPFHQWPLGRGFDRFYGFMDGETDQFNPDLTYDNHRVPAPKRPEDGYHLSEDLVDHAIEFIHDSVSIRPDRPFFLYFAFGATHAPHQAPPDYLAKYRGAFDEGWDITRERWFANQVRLGLTPEGTQLAPRNPGVAAWDELPDNQRRLAARMQEAFAAFLDHTDAQIGRLVDDLRAIGRLDNTIILVVTDNGASQEGGPFGVMHEMKFFNGLLEQPDEAIARIDDIGGPHSHTNYPWGWAQAGNAPFKWYKQNTHEGGVHVPLVVHWPAGISDAGGIRHQFHHATDIAPTIYELLSIEAPAVHRGYEQLPIAGTSMAYTFAEADVAGRKQVQYFEMGGHRAIYHDGWKAVTRHTPRTSFDDDVWELYHVATDFSECTDLAATQPDKLAEMIELWWTEAERHGVLPLDDRGVELFGATFRDRTPNPVNRHYTYFPPVAPITPQAGAAVGGRSFEMAAQIRRMAGDHGVLYATGTENSGMSLFVQGERLVFDYNAFDHHTIVTSSIDVPVGESSVGVVFRRDGKDGEATVTINGEAVGSAHVPLVMRTISSVGSSIGFDSGSAVSRMYEAPYAFTGTLQRLDVQIAPERKKDAAGNADAAHATEMGRQ
jgi:arylsulfatase A-like enzyme